MVVDFHEGLFGEIEHRLISIQDPSLKPAGAIEICKKIGNLVTSWTPPAETFAAHLSTLEHMWALAGSSATMATATGLSKALKIKKRRISESEGGAGGDESARTVRFWGV